MPNIGQQSIVDAQQQNGTGVVITEWAAFHSINGRWAILSPALLLFTRNSGTTEKLTFTLSDSRHPIWTSLPSTFNTLVAMGANIAGSVINPSTSTIVAQCKQCNGPGVVVRNSSSASIGRIVQIAHAAHYSTFNWSNDANILTMMINAVKWAALLI